MNELCAARYSKLLTLDSAAELAKGLSDVPIALMALIFAFIVMPHRAEDSPKARKWAEVFFLTSASAFMGSFVHVFLFPESVLRWLWIFLYILLYETVRSFRAVLLGVINGTPPTAESRPLRIAVLAAYLLSAVNRFFHTEIDIYVFLVCSLVLLIPVLAALFRKRALWGLKASVLLLVFSTAVQAMRSFIPGAVMIAHVFIAAAMFLILRVAVKDSA